MIESVFINQFLFIRKYSYDNINYQVSDDPNTNIS